VDAKVVIMVINPSKESEEWLMNLNHLPNKELERLRQPKRLRKLLKMLERKWKRWPISKKKKLPTRK